MAEEQPNTNSKRLIIVAAVAVLGLIGISIFLQPNKIMVQDETTDSQQAEADEPADSEDKSSGDAAEDRYTHTAVAGDSYTMVARQVVAALGGELSPAQRVAAETKLTQDAGEPFLEVGQVVELDKEVVQATIDWAGSLSPAEEAAWQPYADMVILPEIK